MLVTMTPYAYGLFLNDIKADILTAPGMLVKLFQNNIVPTPANVLADFTEATFDGYVAKAVTVMFGPARQADGSFRISNFDVWSMTGTTTPNTIYGMYVLDRLGNLLYAARFAAPVSMVDTFSVLSVENELVLAVNGITGDPEPV